MEKTKRRVKTETVAVKEPLSQGSRALAKGLEILRVLTEREAPQSLAQIALGIGLGKASALRLLRTLQSTGLIERVGGDRYTAAATWPAARPRASLSELRRVALPVMRRLSVELGETAALAYLFEDHIRVVEVIESSHHIRMSNYPDRILQPYASSLGKAIAAYQTPERVQRLLDVYGIYQLTTNTIVGIAAIREELAKVRERGYAEDREETVPGGICVGAPIRAGGEVVASISVSTPHTRFTARHEEQVPLLVRQAAEEISAALDLDAR
ncbi:MAG: IclR family transcriptional regulator [Bryobacterales bacterium]|nr:IclR family transcriptional regulator [Bryobacterales bacterium]